MEYAQAHPRNPHIDAGLTDAFEHIHSNKKGFYGWAGLGGSVFMGHPELNIGFSYVPTDLLVFD